MRCNTAVLPEASTAQLANALLSSGVQAIGRELNSGRIPIRYIQPNPALEDEHQRLRWSKAGLWAWEDLNLRPHPYQQSRAYRCATLRFCSSCATVGGEVMRCSKGWPKGG